MPTLSLKETRTIILKSQLLWGKAPKGKAALRKVIEQLSYVQIDTISVIARAHHHVLRTRVADYTPEMLKSLVENDRSVFEYWAHAAAYLPVKDYRYYLYRKNEIAKDKGHWRKKDSKIMTYVYDQIKAEGPLLSKHFKDLIPKDEPQAWGGYPARYALHQLFMEGEIMISGRQGFQKIYDLSERVLPAMTKLDMPSAEEYWRFIIKRDVQANGLIRLKHIGHLLKKSKIDLKTIVNKMIEEGEIKNYTIKSLDGFEFLGLPSWEEEHFNLSKKKQIHILSPFDNLIIQRGRLKEIFDFDYTLECYVTAAKRKIGYFSLPLLWGDTFIGQVDMKADRKKKVLEIRNFVWEEAVKKRDHLVAPLQKAFKDFQQYNDCNEISIANSIAKKALPFIVG